MEGLGVVLVLVEEKLVVEDRSRNILLDKLSVEETEEEEGEGEC